MVRAVQRGLTTSGGGRGNSGLTNSAIAGWNRVHLDARPYPANDLEAEAARLRALGATAVDLDQDVPWTVLADPEGNEFCLLGPSWLEPARGTCRRPIREVR
ncbi:VOC family protein [Micromonospora musae]|uniref:VOC family protein n=1 Tax=Micromonospora musae TaxID=1894970 RepID=UPI003F4DDF72